MLSRGNTSDVYVVGADAVVKVPRPEVPDHWIEIEASHAAAVHAAGLPTPMVLDVLDVDGRPSIVFERVDGPSMSERLAASPAAADSLARDMVAIQREFHAATAPDELPPTSERVAGKIHTAQGLGPDERATATELLRTLPAGSSVCHGDIHPGNILLGADGPMVIDWFDATRGPPLADSVRSSLLVRPLRAWEPSPHLPGVPAAVLDRFHRTYVHSILRQPDVDAVAALAWEAVLAVSRLSEPVEWEAPALLEVWRQRADLSIAPTTPLASLLRVADGSSAE